MNDPDDTDRILEKVAENAGKRGPQPTRGAWRHAAGWEGARGNDFATPGTVCAFQAHRNNHDPAAPRPAGLPRPGGRPRARLRTPARRAGSTFVLRTRRIHRTGRL
ncbi:hypothetical protein GCM10010508_21920 [Streptomyces naganishii JCM 4654]|uniref:Uncharacterized protein n=1 Tax=Streptomyces naganishii JCM 4654 TaxID=1306179 RepID=A0A919CV10_9ACTN|nr:hypothetical protein GCM10010508_21920 [Streptomyces naganishii JCM 4654]